MTPPAATAAAHDEHITRHMAVGLISVCVAVLAAAIAWALSSASTQSANREAIQQISGRLDVIEHRIDELGRRQADTQSSIEAIRERVEWLVRDRREKQP